MHLTSSICKLYLVRWFCRSYSKSCVSYKYDMHIRACSLSCAYKKGLKKGCRSRVFLRITQYPTQARWINDFFTYNIWNCASFIDMRSAPRLYILGVLNKPVRIFIRSANDPTYHRRFKHGSLLVGYYDSSGHSESNWSARSMNDFF